MKLTSHQLSMEYTPGWYPAASMRVQNVVAIVANVAGDACGRVLPGANPAHVIRGCVTDEDGTADVAGDIIWYYTPRDGMTDY